MEKEEDREMSCVSGFNPSVTGVTGMETADVIESIVKIVRPEAVLIVDSLAARNIERVSTTIQLCDTGISPGAGMGNRRKEISQDTLGCKVIAIGVPTVIDSKTLIIEAAEELNFDDEEKLQEYFQNRTTDMIVTSSDIDQVIKDFSDIISKAINISLHPGIYF
jgi:spore protease